MKRIALLALIVAPSPCTLVGFAAASCSCDPDALRETTLTLGETWSSLRWLKSPVRRTGRHSFAQPLHRWYAWHDPRRRWGQGWAQT